MGQGAYRSVYIIWSQWVLHLWLTATCRPPDYPRYTTNNHRCSFSRWGREGTRISFCYKRGQECLYDCPQPIGGLITQDARPNILDAPLTLIWMYGMVNICCHWSLYKWLFWLIGCLSFRLGLSPLAKLNPVIFLHGPLSFYQNWYIKLNIAFHQLYICLWKIILMRLPTILPENFSMWNSQSSNIQSLGKHIDPICATFSCFPNCSFFPLHWQSSTTFQPVSLTSVSAESIQEQLVWRWQCCALDFPKPWCHCLVLHRIHCLPHNCLHSCFD